MISYHLPAETMDILAGRLDDPWLIYDQVTDQTVTEMKNLKNSKNFLLANLLRKNQVILLTVSNWIMTRLLISLILLEQLVFRN